MLLQKFSQRVASKVGALDWVSIATMIAEMIAGCMDNAKALGDAIDGPTGLQRLRLGLRSRKEFGWRDGGKVADAIASEAKSFRAEYAAGPDGLSFEDAVLAEVADL